MLYNENFPGVFVTSETMVGYFNMQNYQRGIVDSSKEKIFSLPFAMYLKKHSCLTSTIDGHVQRLASNGFLAHWWKKYQDTRFLKNRLTKTPQILTMDQIQGIHYICFYLHIISIIIFLLELCSIKCKVLRRGLKYF